MSFLCLLFIPKELLKDFVKLKLFSLTETERNIKGLVGGGGNFKLGDCIDGAS